MTARAWTDAPQAVRCKATVTLSDGSTAQCGRRRAEASDRCWQHTAPKPGTLALAYIVRADAAFDPAVDALADLRAVLERLERAERALNVLADTESPALEWTRKVARAALRDIAALAAKGGAS